MADASILTEADRQARRRRRFLIVISGIVVLARATAASAAHALRLGSSHTGDIILFASFWLAVLYLVWSVNGSGRRSPALNDELTRANRSRALQFGYWGLFALAALAYGWSVLAGHFEQFDADHLILTAVVFGAVGPAWFFAALEEKAEKSD
jgi:hypothetical protein